MKVAYVSEYDSRDIRHFSGIAASAAQALTRQGCNVEYVGPLQERLAVPLKVKQQFYRSVLRQDHHRNREPIILRHYARQVSEALDRIQPDVVFAPTSIPLAYLETRIPIVLWADATFAAMVGYYPEFSGLSRETINNGHRAERQVIQRAALVIYSSDWAARSAIRDCGASPDKVNVIPFGAILDSDPTRQEVEAIVGARSRSTCRLLFLGMDWHRKGGPLAYDVVRSLNRSGLSAELTIIGCDPPLSEPVPDYVHRLGFVSKKTPEGRRTISRALAEAHFLILPTHAEAMGLVFCEASAYGVPSLATRTGGVPSVVTPGRNGHLFDLDASVEQYVSCIAGYFADYPRYEQLARTAFEEYEQRLNWDAAGRNVYNLLRQIV